MDPEYKQYFQYFAEMPGYVTVQDRDFRIIDANKRFREDFGDFEGRYCYQVYKRRPDRCEVCPVARTFRDGQRHESQEQVQTPELPGGDRDRDHPAPGGRARGGGRGRDLVSRDRHPRQPRGHGVSGARGPGTRQAAHVPG